MQGIDLLEEMQQHLQAKGARLVLADPSPKLARLFERSGLKSHIGGLPGPARVPACLPACALLLEPLLLMNESPDRSMQWASPTAGEEWIFGRVHDAVVHCRKQLGKVADIQLALSADSSTPADQSCRV